MTQAPVAGFAVLATKRSLHLLWGTAAGDCQRNSRLDLLHRFRAVSNLGGVSHGVVEALRVTRHPRAQTIKVRGTAFYITSSVLPGAACLFASLSDLFCFTAKPLPLHSSGLTNAQPHTALSMPTPLLIASMFNCFPATLALPVMLTCF